VKTALPLPVFVSRAGRGPASWRERATRPTLAAVTGLMAQMMEEVAEIAWTDLMLSEEASLESPSVRTS
jgi:hypothetical protein